MKKERKIVKAFFILLLIFLIVPSYKEIDQQRGKFLIGLDESFANGRILRLNDLNGESCFKEPLDSLNIKVPSQRNMMRLGDSCIAEKIDEFLIKYLRPVYVHRMSGLIDTLYTTPSNSVGVGYVSRVCWRKKWLVVESKQPWKCLGYSCLADTNFLRIPKERLTLMDYTYEGQRLVFEWENSDFWIASRTTKDIWGPLTEEDVGIVAKQLGIKTPITLKGYYDRYVYSRIDDEDGSIVHPFPKEFYYPNHVVRPNKTITP